MLNYCAQHKCRTEDMVRLAQTHLGQDVQASLDATYKGSLPKDWDEVRRTLQTWHVQFDHKVRVELWFDGLSQRSNLQAYMD
jgi:hypothetical protein